MSDPNAVTQRSTVQGESAPPRAGIRTSEFWLSSIATVLGIVLASGAIPEGGMVGQIIGGALSVLASLGYTASRTQVKGRA
jgi:hypothetical protein